MSEKHRKSPLVSESCCCNLLLTVITRLYHAQYWWYSYQPCRDHVVSIYFELAKRKKLDYGSNYYRANSYRWSIMVWIYSTMNWHDPRRSGSVGVASSFSMLVQLRPAPAHCGPYRRTHKSTVLRITWIRRWQQFRFVSGVLSSDLCYWTVILNALLPRFGL